MTAPSRTLLDLTVFVKGRPLERAVDEAESLRLCGAAELEGILNPHRGEPGAGPLGKVLRSHQVGSTPTRTELEECFLALCRRHHLPQPLVNAPLHDLTVDFLWEPAKLVVEVDGCLTLRFTWRDVTRRPAVVAHRVRRVLADRAS